MSKRHHTCRLIVFMVFAILTGMVFGETQEALKIYVDCEWCDLNFIKTELPYVNYVIDRKDADVYVLITSQPTAPGGVEYTITFVGQRDFKGMCDTLRHIAVASASDDAVRKGIVHKLKLGLVRYIAITPEADDIVVARAVKPASEALIDKWRSWVFTVSLSASLDGEQSRHFTSLFGSVTINKTTDDIKTELYSYYDYDRNSYDINDTTTVTSESKGYGSSWYDVYSVSDHWSLGCGIDIYSSTYRNKKLGCFVWPAVEYNIFPYIQSTRRQIRLLYKVGYVYTAYDEETIYDKNEDRLFHEALSVTLDTKQQWGTVHLELWGSHYFHDFGKNRFSIYNSISLPLFKGLSFTLSGNVSMIHDQLSLPKRDLTQEEILLQIRQLSTQYDYYARIGFSYTFGSLYSNVVNPRFGY